MRTQAQQTSTAATPPGIAAQTSRGARSLAGTARARKAAVRLRDMSTVVTVSSCDMLPRMACGRRDGRGKCRSPVCIVRMLTLSTNSACPSII